MFFHTRVFCAILFVGLGTLTDSKLKDKNIWNKTPIGNNLKETCKNGWKKLLIKHSPKCNKFPCPNTYKCVSEECCQYPNVTKCNPEMKNNTNEPWPCVGIRARRCSQGFQCIKEQSGRYSMCCPTVKCFDKDGEGYKLGETWKSPYDDCNTCQCDKNGTHICTDKTECKMCTIPEENNRQQKIGYKYQKGCDECECVSNNVINCKGPCEQDNPAKGPYSTFTPCPTTGLCGIKARVQQCRSKNNCTGYTLETVHCSSKSCRYAGVRGTQISTKNKKRSVHGTDPMNRRKPYIWSWMVFIPIGDHFCGGSIISPKHVLTAAHCIQAFPGQNEKPKNVQIIVGRWNLTENITKEQRQKIKGSNIIIHENYFNGYENNDIAILELDKPLSINNDVTPVLLPKSKNENIDDMLCRVTGWGGTENASFSEVLLEIQIKKQTCNLPTYAHHLVNDRTMFCAHKLGRDACHGDSGGPYMCRQPAKIEDGKVVPGKWVQYGIVSWGISTCGKYSGVYTNVLHYLDWIQDKISTDGGWGTFSGYTECSVTCGGGWKSRVRVCNNPAPIGRGTCVAPLGKKKVDPRTDAILDVQMDECNTDNC